MGRSQKKRKRLGLSDRVVRKKGIASYGAARANAHTQQHVRDCVSLIRCYQSREFECFRGFQQPVRAPHC